MTDLRMALIDFTSIVFTLGVTAVVVGTGLVFAYLVIRNAMRP